MTIKVQSLRKLTIRACGWNKTDIIKALPADNGAELLLLKMAGEVTEARLGQTDKGEYLRLIGDFAAENPSSGQRFVASQAILPSFIADALGAALRNTSAVGFAIEIGAKADSTSITGYVYTVRSLMPVEPSDRMKRLLQAAGMSPALPAPSA